MYPAARNWLGLGRMDNDPQAGSPRDCSASIGRSQLIKGVISYINENYMENIHLGSIAKKFWVSPSYLSRQFREKLGLTITLFIMEHRIYIAKKLLLTTDAQIAEIADKVGFNSVAYFNTVFKRIAGVSPREYRSQMKVTHY